MMIMKVVAKLSSGGHSGCHRPLLQYLLQTAEVDCGAAGYGGGVNSL